MKMGVVFRPGNLWLGAHWSGYNRRWCVTVIPMVTVWVTLKGGVTPRRQSSPDPAHGGRD